MAQIFRGIRRRKSFGGRHNHAIPHVESLWVGILDLDDGIFPFSGLGNISSFQSFQACGYFELSQLLPCSTVKCCEFCPGLRPKDRGLLSINAKDGSTVPCRSDDGFFWPMVGTM